MLLGTLLKGCAASGLVALVTTGAEVHLVTMDNAAGELLPCRIHLKDSSDQPVRAPGLPFWRDHFACDGRMTLNLPAGHYSCEIERGPEYRAVSTNFVVVEGAALHLTNRLGRLVDMAAEGWWSGDLHVHRPVDDIEQLMRAEDLHIAPVITWWNNTNPWTKAPLPTPTLRQFDGNRFYDLMGGEDERGGGALLYFGLKKPLAIAGARREHPSPMKFLRAARSEPGVWVDIEKPFWWDAPAWAASGLVDSIGIVHNHMHRGGMLDNEAWGRPRDLARHPGPHGNGHWTQEIYYHLLNCGLRLPPSAGSASGVLPNPPGHNRVYVHLDGPLTWNTWWAGLRAGRVFVSNGPLLRCRANGQWPGHVFSAPGPLTVRLETKLDSRDPVKQLELVRNGKATALPANGEFEMKESGWFLVRALADLPHTFRFASTGPFYVEVGGKPAPPREASARFFLEWTQTRMTSLKLEDPGQREEVLGTLREAEAFWQRKLAAATQAPTDQP